MFKLTGHSSRAYHPFMEAFKNESAASRLLSISRALLVAARPKQWTKNLIIYFALFFTLNEVWDPGDANQALPLIGKTTLAFVLFSALSAAVYLMNDILDIEKDRHHSKKRSRPIASGRLPVPIAWLASAVLAMVSLSLSFVLEPMFFWVALSYMILMIAYALVLKDLVLLDVFSISGGFVLRAVASAAVLQVPISPWLYTCTGLGALLIALAKRRSELVSMSGGAGTQRSTLEWYTKPLVDQFISIVAPSTLLAYTLYTFNASNLPENHAMMLTIPFVVYGLFRYMLLVYVRNLGENPEDVLITDVPLIISIVLWLATSASILVMFRG